MARREIVLVVVLATVLGARCVSVHPQQSTTATAITGTLLGADGSPMPLAHLHLRTLHDRRPLARSVVAPDGHFALTTTATGPLRLEFSGVDHEAGTIPLVLDRHRVVELDVRLAHHRHSDNLERVAAIGDWNDFSVKTARPLVRQADGRYVLELATTADTLAYQLLYVTEEPVRINGSDGEWYVYDGAGGYRSVIRATNGRARVVLDPRILDRRTSMFRVAFRDPQSRDARLYEILRFANERVNAYYDTLRVVQATGDSLPWDWGPIISRLRERLAEEPDPLVRHLLLLNLVRVGGLDHDLDVALLDRVTREVAPSSPWWSFDEFRYTALASLGLPHEGGLADGTAVTSATISRRTLPYLERVAQEHPDSSVRASALVMLVLGYNDLGENTQANEYLQRLVAGYPDTPDIPSLRARVSPDRVLRAGAAISDFRFMALADSTVTYTPESLRGRVYLVEFWATWCEPCIRDMPYLHQAYERFGSKELAILSVSVDAKPSDVHNFRAGRWKMPWLHAFARGGFEDPALKRLEVSFLPRAALVDRNGRIVATDSDLWGPKLVPAVESALR